ncbi:MAG: hypothetical protein ABIN48_12040 [Ginsengibacter sp.]
MKAVLFGLILYTTPYVAQNKMTSQEYVPKEFTVVASGTESPQNSKLVIICFNKHINKEKFSTEFIKDNNLDDINYKQNMAVEIFLGSVNDRISNLKIDKIEESKEHIRISYSFESIKTDDSKVSSSPYIIVQTPKSKKPVIFFENGSPLKMSDKSLLAIL